MNVSTEKDERNRIIDILTKHIEKHSNSKRTRQEKIHEICSKLRTSIDEFEYRINKEMEESFNKENDRLQSLLSILSANTPTDNEFTKIIQEAKVDLLVTQTYDVIEKNGGGTDFNLFNVCELKVNKSIVSELFCMEKPTNVIVTGVNGGRISIQFTHLSPDEVGTLSRYNVEDSIKYKCLFSRKEGNVHDDKEYLLEKTNNCFGFIPNNLNVETPYEIRVKTVVGDNESEWSDKTEFSLKFNDISVWKECSDHVNKKMKYSVEKNNPKVVTKVNGDEYCTVASVIPLPLNSVISWNIKILKSQNNDGGLIFIGVAPFDINQNISDNYNRCGWYFACYSSTLFSGPPYSYRGKQYGPRKGDGQYTHEGDSVGVVMDTTKGELSFIVNEVNHGVAYKGIPIDKPLIPCVLIKHECDSIEFDAYKAKEIKINDFTPIPSNIKAENGTTWDSITLTWDVVDGASFYQIEADENVFYDSSSMNTFTKRGFLSETEHSFRVRAVKGNSAGDWSDVVNGRTIKESFEGSWWKECPNNTDEERKYSVDENNTRIVSKGNGDMFCAIIGTISIPLSKAASWSIKMLKSNEGNGRDIYIGVAPSDINQNEDNVFNKSGWYIDCYESILRSGPPHNYGLETKEYGPRKEIGKYVHTGETVSIIMDTAKGDLSFVVNGVNLGVAYEGIPLDKPLVPCVIIRHQGDSVELDTSEVKESLDSSISIPSNIKAESITWDSITLTWDDVEWVSFYQVEVDRGKLWDTSTNTFTKAGFLPDTEHSFKVRTICGNLVSKWSDIAIGRTQKMPELSECVWRVCPDDVCEKMKYYVDKKNPRIATKIGEDKARCTITGNAALPLNKVSLWSIKILKSKMNDGTGINIGVALSDINKNDDDFRKYGWYFYCYDSTLWSGPPHDCRGKEYGSRKEDGKYIHTGDTISIIMDTTKGELSFIINKVNLGVAYEGIPLDKPLVPCVLLYYKRDSVRIKVLDSSESCVII